MQQAHFLNKHIPSIGQKIMADVKICGIKTIEDLAAVSTAGARWVGFVFYPKSPRHLSVEDARRLRQAVEDIEDKTATRPLIVALTVDADDAQLQDIVDAARPDFIQCHGQETPERISAIKSRFGVSVMKAIRVKNADTLSSARAYDGHADMMLFDSAPVDADLPGGTGHAFDWGLMAAWQGTTPWMLAGGLTPENVAQAITISGANAVDVSSGVETAPGNKDHAAIHRFVSAVQ